MVEGLEGGCACGAARYRLSSAPMFVHCCHCRDCQRQTGGAFAINALIETDRVEVLSGDIRPVPVPTPSGRPHDIHRCAACATALWSDYGRRKVMSFLRVATLDDPTAIAPDVHIFTRSRLPWAQVTGAPSFEVYYDMKTLWPPASLARRRALLGDV
ncbi:MAG TPA: GFA family protein [Phenylobacterium sp.]|nr:GFA family protein [Phenylobacterium sp.]